MNSIFQAMKKLMFVLIGAALLLECQAVNDTKNDGNQKKSKAQNSTLTIAATPDLYEVATRWVEEYAAINPNLKISLRNSGDPGLSAEKGSEADLTFISSEQGATIPVTDWKMVIGRDAVVPVLNAANPFLDELNRQGISAAEFAWLLGNEADRNWSFLLGKATAAPINVYLPDDESLTSSLAGFTGLEEAAIGATVISGHDAWISAIQKDPYAIGFCRLADITGPDGQNLAGGLALLPIDKNGNGKMDYIEKIYDNVSDLSRGIWIGKYPRTLCRSLYVCSTLEPEEENETGFLKYVLTGGQQFLEKGGFNSLVSSERLSKIDRLPSAALSVKTSAGINLPQLIITLLAGLAVIISLLIVYLRFRRNNQLVTKSILERHPSVLTEKSLAVPKGLFFDKSHTWAFMETDGTVRIGIDDFLQHVTGQITSIRMKKPGERVRKGELLLTIIQKGKRLNISAPVSGVILADNSMLFTDSTLINSSPYSDGWICRIEPTNWIRETQFLLMSEKYTEWIRSEFTRLRDFLAGIMKPDDPRYAFVVLQDGGELTDHPLENLSPEVWEDFQIKFIDASK